MKPRYPICPICKKSDTIATTVFENDDTFNTFVVSCHPSKGGCGLSTNINNTWPEATAEWIKLCNEKDLPRNIVTRQCDCGCLWHDGINMSLGFDEVIAALEDSKICPNCGNRVNHIKSYTLRNNEGDEYEVFGNER